MAWLDSLSLQQNWSGYISQALYWLGIVFWIIFGIVIVYFAYQRFTYAIPIEIWDVVGSTTRRIKKTKGRIFTKDGVTKLELLALPFQKARQLPPPSDDYYQLTNKGKLLTLLKENANYTPFKFSANPGHVTIQDYDIRFWATQTMGSIIKKYTQPTFWEKHGAIMTFIFGLLVLGWMYYITLQQTGSQFDKAVAMYEKIANAIGGKLGGAP